MADYGTDKKSTDLDIILGADVASNDVFLVGDTSDAGKLKQIAQSQMLEGLDVTATATELNILDGATLSTAELNQLDDNTFDSSIDVPSINITGTNGNGHAHFKHQATDPSTSASSTVVFADADGDLSFKIHGGTTKVIATTENISKLGYISVTQAVDLDQIESRVNDLDAAVVLKGTWDASTGVFPASGAAQAGWSYINSYATEVTIDGIKFNQYDRLVAIVDNASTSTYASNWLKLDYTDQVLSVAGKTGAVSLDKSDVGLGNVDNTSDSNKPVSTAQQTALNAKQDTLVSTTNIKSINGVSILGAGDLTVSATTFEMKTAAPSSNQNDYAISGMSTSKNVITVVRVTPTASFKFTGFDATGVEDGKTIILENSTSFASSSSYYFIIERSSASSSAANRVLYDPNGFVCIVLPGESVAFRYDAADSLWHFCGGSQWNESPKAYFDQWADGFMLTELVTGSSGTSSVVIGTQFTATGSVKPLGVVALSTTSSSAIASWVGGGSYFRFGVGCALTIGRVGIDTTLSTGSETWFDYVGFMDGSGATNVDVIGWKYDAATSSAWQTCTMSNTTETLTTGQGPTANTTTMPYFGAFVNGNGTRVDFFYSEDGDTWTICGTSHTTNIPNTNIRLAGIGAQRRRTAAGGASARVLAVDFLGGKLKIKRGS